MDKIAVISDIHGNMPALEAVLSDIRSRKIEKIFCLGDLVGKGPHSDRAIDIIKETCEVVVYGNWDDGITKVLDDHDINKWHQDRIGTERMKYLCSLDFSFEFYMSGKFVRLFHASPFSVYKRIQPGAPIEERLSMFENTEMTGIPSDNKIPDVIGYGDIHNAYVQNFMGKTLFNVGSVGNPLEITQASYAILEGRYQSREPGSFSIQLVRVPYDIELAIWQALEENMPLLEPYAIELRTAVYRGKHKK